MKSKIIILALFAMTAASVLFYPTTRGAVQPVDPLVISPVKIVNPVGQQRPIIEAVFVLDTTGSMGGLIQAAKDKIWSIATTMSSAQPTPELRLGLVAYRDRGDAYVTRVVDLSSDLDQVYATLMDFEAGGGGDGPESVNQALYEAVNGISWSQDQDAYKVVFLVGDAPPHMDYQDEVQYPVTLVRAREKGIVVNTIQCGNNGLTGHQWQQIAQLGSGDFFQVGQSGSAVVMSTPFDERLAELSAALDETRLFYGDDEAKDRARKKVAASEKIKTESSVEALARRAAFNASDAGAKNLTGDADLVEDVVSGRVSLDDVAPATLPESMQAMAPAEQEAVIEETAQRRNDIRQEIQQLAEKRDAFARAQVDAVGGARSSLDYKLYSTVKEQAAAKGLEYAEEEPDY